MASPPTPRRWKGDRKAKGLDARSSPIFPAARGGGKDRGAVGAATGALPFSRSSTDTGSVEAEPDLASRSLKRSLLTLLLSRLQDTQRLPLIVPHRNNPARRNRPRENCQNSFSADRKLQGLTGIGYTPSISGEFPRGRTMRCNRSGGQAPFHKAPIPRNRLNAFFRPLLEIFP